MSKEIRPQKAEEYVKIEYWRCNVVGHRHRTERSAASCIVKRKGEAGALKKLQRNISMLVELRGGESIINISKTHFCSDANVTKTVSSMLNKAWKIDYEGGRSPYSPRQWRRADFTDPSLEKELDHLTNILLEMEVKLRKILNS